MQSLLCQGGCDLVRTPRGSVSVKDVAALAGVSTGTVSNALNAPDKVSDSTRDKVAMAIAKLGWVRNESARHLGGGRSRTVGMVLMDIANPFFTDVLRGAEDTVYSRGFAVHVGNSGLDRSREAAHLELFEQDRVRGVLIAPVVGISVRAVELERRGTPVVVLDRVEDGLDLCTVSVDDVEGGRLAVDHLLSLGHRRLALVGGSGEMHQVRDRRLGAELARAGVPGPGSTLLTLSTSGLDAESGLQAARELALLPTEERPTAVFAVNDLLAIGLLQGFMTLGISVPEDVAIIGYDDITFAGTAAVPLSSVRQPTSDLGRRAAELLFEEIGAQDGDGVHRHQHVRFTPSLVVRTSTMGRATR
jgi:LacI family transcriptional regulator